MKEFIHLHLHTDYSNANMVEVASRTEQYIDLSSQYNSKAMAITEHGNIFNWTIKKDKINSAGMKYIHGVEVYVTEDLNGKIRDNYHLILLAKNYEGVKEINRLVSNSFQGKGDKESGDSHFYYNPRISYEELTLTSDNVLILTACLGSPLWQTYKANLKDDYARWMDFFVKNKHRVWLEVQPHDHPEQKVYNKILLEAAKTYDMNLVATNDVHAHSERANEVRKILMKGKNIRFEDDDESTFELWWKNYNEMQESFTKQGVLTQEEISQVLNEPSEIVEMIEDFEFDRKPKYPRIFKNPIQQIQKYVLEGYDARGLNLLPKEQQKVYQDRVKRELTVMAKTDTVDYLLLEHSIKKAMREDNRYGGPGRGSSAGSLVAYLLNIVDVDPIKHDLLFERFMNEDRQKGSVADIDSDYGESDREWVQTYLLTHDIMTCAAICTFSTLGVKSSFKEIGRGMGYDFSELNSAVQGFETFGTQDVIPAFVKQQYPELCQIAEEVEGIVIGVSRHAAGVIVSDKDLMSEIGIVEVKDFKYAVSSIDMNGVDKLQYVKLDVLGLKNIEWIQRAVALAGLDRMSPQSKYVDFNDWNVAEEISKDNTAIFQFESPRTGKVVKEILSEKSLARIREFNPDIEVVDLLSVATAVIRPGAVSIVEDVMEGKPKENGYKDLDEMMADSFGYMIYQEQSIKFMTDFADMSGAEADTIRRAIGKKKRDVIDHEVPIIKEKFIEAMMNRYGDSREKIEPIADEFMAIFLASADYSFNKSHSIAYSYITYETAWLRTYYPLEYVTAGLQIWINNKEKTNRLISFAKSKGITIKAPRFRYSKGEYFMDKETNSIYQGTAPIKGNNAKIGNILYELKENKYDNFVDFLVNIRDNINIVIDNQKMTFKDIFSLSEDKVKELDKKIKQDQKEELNKILISSSSYPVDKTKMLSLIRLNFFEEFGGAKKLEKVFIEFDKTYKASNKTFKSKQAKYIKMIDFEKSLDDEKFSVFEQCEYELFYLSRINIINDNIPARYGFVQKIDQVGKTRTSATIYNINKGIEVPVKVGSKTYRNVPFEEGDLIEIIEAESKAKVTKVDGVWGKHPTEKELWLKNISFIRKGSNK